MLLVDLTFMTKCLYERLGVENSKKYHAAKTESPEDFDNTHLNAYGAFEIAKLVCEDVAKKDCVFAGLMKTC